jgi:hypothetical protein
MQFTLNLYAYANSVATIRIADSVRTVVTPQPTTPVVQPPTVSLIDSFRDIVSDLVQSFDSSLARSFSPIPDASSAASSSSAAASSSSASGISAALRGNGSLVTNVIAANAGSTAQFFDAFGVLRALTQYSTAVPVNTVRPLATSASLDSLSLAVPNSPTGLKRLEFSRYSFSDQIEDQADNQAGNMGRLPKAEVNPGQPMPMPEKTNPDKGADQNKPTPQEIKPQLPDESKQPEEETASEVLSMTWVDPTDTPEQQPTFTGTESLRNYAATVTVALALGGWWNQSPSVASEKERRRLAWRLRG